MNLPFSASSIVFIVAMMSWSYTLGWGGGTGSDAFSALGGDTFLQPNELQIGSLDVSVFELLGIDAS